MSSALATSWKALAYGTLVSVALLGAHAGGLEKPSQLKDSAESPPRNDSASGWAMESSSPDLTIYSRVREGTSLKEFKGVGEIDAAPAAVFAVLDDSESYPSFMPYTAECRVLKREKDGGALPSFVRTTGAALPSGRFSRQSESRRSSRILGDEKLSDLCLRARRLAHPSRASARSMAILTA